MLTISKEVINVLDGKYTRDELIEKYLKLKDKLYIGETYAYGDVLESRIEGLYIDTLLLCWEYLYLYSNETFGINGRIKKVLNLFDIITTEDKETISKVLNTYKESKYYVKNYSLIDIDKYFTINNNVINFVDDLMVDKYIDIVDNSEKTIKRETLSNKDYENRLMYNEEVQVMTKKLKLEKLMNGYSDLDGGIKVGNIIQIASDEDFEDKDDIIEIDLKDIRLYGTGVPMELYEPVYTRNHLIDVKRHFEEDYGINLLSIIGDDLLEEYRDIIVGDLYDRESDVSVEVNVGVDGSILDRLYIKYVLDTEDNLFILGIYDEFNDNRVTLSTATLLYSNISDILYEIEDRYSNDLDNVIKIVLDTLSNVLFDMYSDYYSFESI